MSDKIKDKAEKRATALRDNLQKRKQQAKTRKSNAQDNVATKTTAE